MYIKVFFIQFHKPCCLPDEDVLRCEVAVKHALVVEVLQTPADVEPDLQDEKFDIFPKYFLKLFPSNLPPFAGSSSALRSGSGLFLQESLPEGTSMCMSRQIMEHLISRGFEEYLEDFICNLSASLPQCIQ